MSGLIEPISHYVWDTKYRYRLNDTIIDKNITDSWQRVANAISLAEKKSNQGRWQKAFFEILEDFRFLPGGRILAGAGTQHEVTLFNCFVMNIKEDSLQGIFDALGEGALTLQQGGGVGYDFSVLRPHGDLVKKTGVNASGPVSFMRIWDSMCGVMLSTGARRGAMMGVLRCDHPDIEEFIAAKHDPHELRHFNVSVMISDAFMQAVKHDELWPLIFPVESEKSPHSSKEIIQCIWGDSRNVIPCRIYKRIPARRLWHDIMRFAYNHAEPGVLFSDTINRMNNLWYRERLNATNPCGEIPLPAYGACNLGSINLTQFVLSPFAENARIDWIHLEEVVTVATRFLDNVIDISQYPLKRQRQQALGTRRIGLGLTGLADALIMLNSPYDSDSSLQLARTIIKRIAEVTWDTSIELAREKESFPFYKKDYLKGAFVATLEASLQRKLKRYGIRNSHHNTIAPAGTISLLANNVSNGIEPVYHADYKRQVRTNSASISFQVQDYAYRLWKERETPVNFPKAWRDTHTLKPIAHLKMQNVMQAYVDNAISKTINIPIHFPFEELSDVYTTAYELGLKGCTIFRPNDITGSVLEVEEKEHCCQHE